MSTFFFLILGEEKLQRGLHVDHQSRLILFRFNLFPQKFFLKEQKLLLGANPIILEIILGLFRCLPCIGVAHNGMEKRVFRPQCSFDVTTQI